VYSLRHVAMPYPQVSRRSAQVTAPEQVTMSVRHVFPQGSHVRAAASQVAIPAAQVVPSSAQVAAPRHVGAPGRHVSA
jgi:hypothetical protein